MGRGRIISSEALKLPQKKGKNEAASTIFSRIVRIIGGNLCARLQLLRLLQGCPLTHQSRRVRLHF